MNTCETLMLSFDWRISLNTLIHSGIDSERESIRKLYPREKLILDQYQQVAKSLDFKNDGDFAVYDHKK